MLCRVWWGVVFYWLLLLLQQTFMFALQHWSTAFGQGYQTSMQVFCYVADKQNSCRLHQVSHTSIKLPHWCFDNSVWHGTTKVHLVSTSTGSWKQCTRSPSRTSGHLNSRPRLSIDAPHNLVCTTVQPTD